jgi:hypothetical protein
MGAGTIAFFAALGAVAWVYSKMLHKTGNNKQTSAIVAGIVGFLVFFGMFVILSFLFENQE